MRRVGFIGGTIGRVATDWRKLVGATRGDPHYDTSQMCVDLCAHRYDPKNTDACCLTIDGVIEK